MLWDPLSSQNTWSPSRKGAQVSALARLEASEDEPEAELSQERDPEPKLDGLGGKAKAAAGAGSAGNRAFVGHQLCERSASVCTAAVSPMQGTSVSSRAMSS